ncbi:MAG: exodeoxyribonuclease VII large subunit [Clostridia bacterium]
MSEYSVSDINEYVATLLSNDKILKNITIKGEVSGYREYPSGHRYFALKDEIASIRCVFFKFNALRLNFKPKDGMKVNAKGYIGLYEKDGQYQFYVESLRDAGTGDLYQSFLKTKAKLEALGYFDIDRKKSLPLLPHKIGVVTSSAGAVICDIINVTRRRFPSMEIVLFHSSVQGEDAPYELASAISSINLLTDADLLIVGRGGGSAEDLSAFNSEIVANAIYNSKIPVISAVGHETDYTIADFVADLRAPTPSAAAELAVPDYFKLCNLILDKARYMNNILDGVYYGILQRLRVFCESGAYTLVTDKIFRYENDIKNRVLEMDRAMKRSIDDFNLSLSSKIDMLDKINPGNVLKRGYSILKKRDGEILTIDNAETGEEVDAALFGGTIKMKVSEVKK